MRYLVFILLILFLITSASEGADNGEPIVAAPEETTTEITETDELLIKLNGADIVGYWEGIDIEETETVEGNAVSVIGNVTVKGKVSGSVVALGGDVFLVNGGKVAGDAVAVAGSVNVEPEAKLAGRRIETIWENIEIEGQLDGDIKTIKVSSASIGEQQLKSVFPDLDIEITNEEVVSFFDDVTVAQNEEIEGDVVAMVGDIEVAGLVHGDVVAVMGDIELIEGAVIHGDIVAVAGTIDDGGAFVKGDIVEVSSKGVNVTERTGAIPTESDDEDAEKVEVLFSEGCEDETDFEDDDSSYSVTFSMGSEQDDVSYNRVEGFGIGISHKFKAPDFDFSLSGALKYRSLLNDRKWAYLIGFEKSFFVPHSFSIGGGLHRQTDSNLLDRSRIGNTENSLAAVLFKQDFRDYYEREGIYGNVSQRLGGIFGKNPGMLTIGVEYRYDTYRDLTTEAGWSIFHGKRSFRSNPAMITPGPEEETLGSLTFELALDTRDDREDPESGWHNRCIAESAGGYLEGAYTFEKYDLILNRYNKLTESSWCDARLWISYSEDTLPLFRQYSLGGPGTLRGYAFNAFSGPMNKMLLANIEVRSELGDGSMQGAVFADAGAVYPVDASIDISDLAVDAGFSILGDGAAPRLDIAKSLTDWDEPIRFVFRIERVF